MTNPLRRLGEMLATSVGWALGGAFFLVGKARGRKALHPRGEVSEGLIRRRGAGRRTGVLWLDEAGTDHVSVRFSRSLGLPATRPDILGLALRVPADHGQFGDVLLATTGTGTLGRYVLLPVRRHGVRAYTSLFPYRTVAGPLLLAVIPTAGSPRQFEIAYSRLTGPWVSFGTLEVTQKTHSGHDFDLSFDPILNVVPGLETYDWTAQLRRFSYAASRRARHKSSTSSRPARRRSAWPTAITKAKDDVDLTETAGRNDGSPPGM
jgi:hypothetical protein